MGKDYMRTATEIDALVTKWSGLPLFVTRRMFLHRLSPAQLHAVGGTEELVAVGFVGLFQAAKKYDPAWLSPKTGKPATFQTFAILCIRHAIYGHVQKNLKHVAVSLDALEPEQRLALEPAVEDPPDMDIWAALSRLHPRQAKIIDLHFRADLPISEIAQQLGVSGTRVRQLLELALHRLEGMLSPS
jgi:RNA polymerase sigma factor (sigma-70 family)